MANIERLQQVIRVLQEVKADNRPFSLRDWFCDLNDEYDGFAPRVTQGDEHHPCGTVGCAIGWCAKDPWHRSQGLSVNFSGPSFEEFHDWIAVEKYFDEPTVERLFGSAEYPQRYRTTIDEVIERIEAFIKESEAVPIT